MKKFRIARCLVNGEIKEYAIFADGSKRAEIEIDDKYGKYFCVDNELNQDCDNILKFSFNDRIKDAVETIRNGNGDAIKTSRILFVHTDVVYFIDRSIGEKIRQKSIEGWKDTKFGWGIKFGNKWSLSGYSLINNKGEAISIFSLAEDQKPKTFETYNDAKDYINDLIVKSTAYAKMLAEKGLDSKDHLYTALDIVRKDIEETYGAKFSIIETMIYDMLNDDGTGPRNEKDYVLNDTGYKIVQTVIE